MGYYERNFQLIRTINQALAEKVSGATAVRVDEPDRVPWEFLSGLGTRGIVFLMGIGSGKLACEIASRLTEKQAFVLFEADLGVLKYAMQKRSLAKLLSLHNLNLFVEKIEDYSFLQPLHMAMTNEACLDIEEKVSTLLHPKIYKAVRKRLLDEKGFLDINLSTAVMLGKNFANSVIRNVPKIMNSPGVNVLYGMFPECPCIICSSGPSLDLEIEMIKKAKGKALIISIDTSLPLLLAHGVVPDVVCGIDPLNDNKALFKGYRHILKNVPAVFLAQYTPDVMRSYPGPVFVGSMPGNMMYVWLSPFWEEKGNVECFGGSVSHFATQLAEYLGCTTIALVGQDLCYKVKYHAGNITKILHDGMGLEEPDETLTGVVTKNRKGEHVYTKPHLQTFRLAFENKIKASPHLKIVNTSVDGIDIHGARFVPLSRFVKQYGIHIDCRMAFESVRQRTPVHAMDVMADALSNAVGIFGRIQSTSLKIINLIHKVAALREAGGHKDEIRTLVKKIEALRPVTQHPITALIGGYYHHIEVYLRKSQVRDVDEIKHKWRRLDAQLERGLNFYGELREACGVLNQELRWLSKRLATNTHAEQVDDERTALAD